MILQNESPEETLSIIKETASQCIDMDELEALRQDKKTVTEIPSNKTAFDTNYELGSAQMRWYFFGEEWSFAFGAEDATATSAVLFHTECDDGQKLLVAEDSFWLEELVNGKWQYVDESKTAVTAEKQEVNVVWNAKVNYRIDWSDSYGALKPGYYRLGRYYTVTLDSGESETRPCYAKFRVMGGDWTRLLDKCEDAMEELLSRESYYLVNTDYLALPSHNDLTWTITTNLWKSGDDALRELLYHDKVNPDLLVIRRGNMVRDGKAYSLEWSGKSVDSPVSFWSANNYTGLNSMERIIKSTYAWYESSIVDVTEIGQEISIMMELDEDAGDGYKYQEVRYYFNSDGTINHIDNLYHPTEGITRMQDKVLEDTIRVMDTSSADIRNLIDMQDVSKPVPFSYEMDVDEYPDAKKDGFVNTTHRAVGDMETAIRLAEKECTMKVQDALSGERYNVVEVYYDETTKIWKVVLRYSQNIEGDQAIYIDNRGITQMIVTYTEENDPENINN